MTELLASYRTLLEEVDGWFAGCVARYPEAIRCAAGCSACCRGLFDITLLDARLLQEGFEQLPAATRREVLARARRRLPELEARWPDFAHPYRLNRYPDAEWTEMPEDDLTPCPLLGADGRCLVYAWRPLTCRLHGLPNIDLTGESFSDAWCTLNFSGIEPLELAGLRWSFRACFEEEIRLFRSFSREQLGKELAEWDTFIPTALLIDFDRLQPGR